jgi:hypothetical protein
MRSTISKTLEVDAEKIAKDLRGDGVIIGDNKFFLDNDNNLIIGG